MRSATVAFAVVTASLLSGCTLYFGNGTTYDDQPFPGDDDAGTGWPYPDASDPSPTMAFARCEDGTIRHVSFSQLPYYTMPGHGAGTLAATKCAAGCRSAIAQCATATDCAAADAAVCNAPIATGPIPTYQGQSCTANSPSPVTYTNTNQCGQVYPGGTCSCNATTSKYGCTATADTASVHAALVGKWHGTVTPPSFATPYQISLWIYPDGTYWAECASANCYAPLYYGGNGPHPWRKISVLSVGDQIGATADIGMFYDFNVGALTSMFVTSTTLHFTFYAAWFGCSQPFDISLTRD